jgi:predicted XRE-type DNA-binding protein
MANQRSQLRGRVIRGTRNVFADLGFPDASERQAKLRLAYALNQVLQTRKVAHANAAKVLGVTQRKLTALREYKLAEFSVGHLVNLLTALDQDVEIVIRPKPRSQKAARIRVVTPGNVDFARKQKAKLEGISFTQARRRALETLRRGLTLQWTPERSRQRLHERG